MSLNPVLPKYPTSAITGTKEPLNGIRMCAQNIDALYSLINGLAPVYPAGSVVTILSEGSGKAVLDKIAGGVAFLRSISSAGTYAGAIAVAAAGSNLTLTFTPGGISLSAWAVPTADISMGTYSITNGAWHGTAIGPTYGGTGQTAVSTGDLLYGSAANTWSRLTANALATRTFLRSVSSGAPAWDTLRAGDIPAIPESGVTNLVTDLAAKAPLNSPTFTGTPAAPTASGVTNTTQIATTAMVQAALSAVKMWREIQVLTFSSEATKTSAALPDTSGLYRVVFSLKQITAAGYLSLRFNADAGAHYLYGGSYITDAGGAVGGTGSAGAATLIPIGLITDVGYATCGSVEVNDPGLNQTYVTGASSCFATPNLFNYSFGGVWDNAAALSTITIFTTGVGALLTGTVSIQQIV